MATTLDSFCPPMIEGLPWYLTLYSASPLSLTLFSALAPRDPLASPSLPWPLGKRLTLTPLPWNGWSEVGCCPTVCTPERKKGTFLKVPNWPLSTLTPQLHGQAKTCSVTSLLVGTPRIGKSDRPSGKRRTRLTGYWDREHWVKSPPPEEGGLCQG